VEGRPRAERAGERIGLPARPSSRRTHAELVQSLRALSDADSSKGFLVRLGTARIPFARAHEIGRILGDVRKAGQPVVCHADEYNNGTLLLASVGCSKVWVSPAGAVDTVGIAAQLIFAKGLLDKINVHADFLQVGKFKGASEPFTREGSSPEARQSLEAALGGLRAAWVAGIVHGRGKPELAGLLEDGPFAPDDAKGKGLVDDVGDIDDARTRSSSSASRSSRTASAAATHWCAGLVDLFRSTGASGDAARDDRAGGGQHWLVAGAGVRRLDGR
jgi:protease-4